MKKSEVPQDDSALNNVSREMCYAQNESGEYETALSKGWNVKKEALDLAWEDVNVRIESAKKEVLENRKSPIYYYMESKLMDFVILSGYTGIWKWRIKRHLKPSVFNSLTNKVLSKYAKAFEITIDELKQVI